MFVDAEKFASSVVASSDSKASVQDKFELYKEAYSYALKANEKTSNENKKRQPSVQNQINHFKNLGL